MNTSESWILKAAESSEKAAKQSSEQGNETKAREQWKQAADFYIQERVFDKAVSCLENAGLLKARALELLNIFDAKNVISVLTQKRFREELALARLHTQNREQTTKDISAFETCCAYAETAGVEKTFALRLLKGAMLTAAWNQDEGSLIHAADLAFNKAALPDDKALILLTKITASGEFELIDELSKIALPDEATRKPYTPFQLRILAVDYLHRGIKLTMLLDAMAAIPALTRYAQLYRALFAGIEAGQADQALENFVSGLIAAADHPDPKVSLHNWQDVERRFANTIYAQPEYLAAGILWDQVWSTRAGVQEIRNWIAQARSHTTAPQWSEVKERFERITAHSLFAYLPKTVQAEVFQLGCVSAFEAECWQQLDKWAVTLEEQHGAKDVLHKLVGAISAEAAIIQEKLRRAAESFEDMNRDRAGEAWAEVKEYARAAVSYTIAGDEHRADEDYQRARASYLRAGLQYTLGGQNEMAQGMRQNARDCEEQIRELERTGVMREQVDATRDQASASRESSVVMAQSLREGFIATSQALISGLTSLAQAQRQAAIQSAEIVFRGFEQLAASQTAGFAQLASTIREGDMQKTLATYAGMKELGRQNAEAIEAFRDAIARSKNDSMNTLKLFDSMTRMLPAKDASASRALPASITQRIVDAEVIHTESSAIPKAESHFVHMTNVHCLLAEGPDGCVVEKMMSDGTIYRQCRIAEGAMTRIWHGFDYFAAKALKQGGCPLPKSRGVLQRHLWLKTCILADGKEHKR